MRRATYLLIALMVVPVALSAQTVGDCEPGEALATLDVNRISSTVSNTGDRPWLPRAYIVPDSNWVTVRREELWIGGINEAGEKLVSAPGSFPELWPGPLTEEGNPPDDCSIFDRIYSVSRTDIENFDLTGSATPDLLDWPAHLGAPTTDGDGVEGNYNLEGGDRPAMHGDQMLWWIMNDAGNEKEVSGDAPLSIEVDVLAYALAETEGPLSTTTFYRYRVTNRTQSLLTDVYIGLRTEPDRSADVYLASDSTLGLGIAYLGSDPGTEPRNSGAALGYDVVHGPASPNNSGTMYYNVENESYQATSFFDVTRGTQDTPRFFENGRYNNLSGLWANGNPLNYGANYYTWWDPSADTITFMYAANPIRDMYWTDEYDHPYGARSRPAFRVFLISTGPFDLGPGESNEATLAIIWSPGETGHDAYVNLLEDDIYVQGRFDLDFAEPEVIDAPVLSASSSDQRIVLSWDNPPSSNNHLESFDARSANVYNKLGPVRDLIYTFEGYEVIEFASPLDSIGKVVAVYDLKNQITGVTEEQYDGENDLYVNRILATGSDAGVQHHHVVEDVINYQDYHFGVRAYAYNVNSRPQVQKSDVARITVVPASVTPTEGGKTPEAMSGDRITANRITGVGDPSGVYVTVVDPADLTGVPYRIEVYQLPDTSALSFSITNASTGETILDGADVLDRRGSAVPFAEDFLFHDGSTMSVTTPSPDFEAFLAIANGSGPIAELMGAAADFQGFPVPNRANSEQQNGDGIWFYATGDVMTGGSYQDVFIRNSIRNGFDVVVPHDYEIRFTPSCYAAWRNAMNVGTPFATPSNGCYGYDVSRILAGNRPLLVPFELWNIGIDTPDDMSDDFRMIPGVRDFELDGYDLQFKDSAVSSVDNDPELDWFTWFNPCNSACTQDDLSPGEDGYLRWQQRLLDGLRYDSHGNEIMADATFINWNGGPLSNAVDKADYIANVVDQDMPEAGSIFRLVTTKPLAAGDVFIIDTQPFAPLTNQQDVATDALARIGISPNPYLGASAYEAGGGDRKVRFTGMPDRATVRIFTLAGTLVRRLDKNSASPFLDWDLRNDEGRIIGSGLFVVHVDVPGVGERVLKFGHIRRK